MANPLLGLISYDSDEDNKEEEEEENHEVVVPTPAPVAPRYKAPPPKKKRRKKGGIRFAPDSELVKAKIFVKDEPIGVAFNEEEHEVCTAFTTTGIERARKNEEKRMFTEFWDLQQEKLKEKEEERLRLLQEQKEESEREAAAQRKAQAEEEKRKWFESRERARKQREEEERLAAQRAAAEKEKMESFMASLSALADDDEEDDVVEGKAENDAKERKKEEEAAGKPENDSGWQMVLDTHSGGMYYWNAITGGVSWEKPEELEMQENGGVKRKADEDAHVDPMKRRKIVEEEVKSTLETQRVKVEQLLLSFALFPNLALSYKELNAEKMKAEVRLKDFMDGELEGDFLKRRLDLLNDCITYHETLGLPSDWTRVWDRGSGSYYYANNKTGRTSWEFPES